MSERKIIQVEDKVPFKLLLPLSIQHMFAMFGASVLVPFIFGINPAIIYERCGNFDFYDSDQGEGAGILRFQLCISCTGRNRY